MRTGIALCSRIRNSSEGAEKLNVIRMSSTLSIMSYSKLCFSTSGGAPFKLQRFNVQHQTVMNLDHPKSGNFRILLCKIVTDAVEQKLIRRPLFLRLLSPTSKGLSCLTLHSILTKGIRIRSNLRLMVCNSNLIQNHTHLRKRSSANPRLVDPTDRLQYYSKKIPSQSTLSVPERG